jgi:hypothetical protein
MGETYSSPYASCGGRTYAIRPYIRPPYHGVIAAKCRDVFHTSWPQRGHTAAKGDNGEWGDRIHPHLPPAEAGRISIRPYIEQAKPPRMRTTTNRGSHSPLARRAKNACKGLAETCELSSLTDAHLPRRSF